MTLPRKYTRVCPRRRMFPTPTISGDRPLSTPGDSVYYSAPEPHDKARAADTVLDAVRRTACAVHEPGLARKPRTGGGNGSGYSIWVERPPAQIRRTIPPPVIIEGSNAAHGGIAYGETAEAEPELFDVGC